VTFPLVQSSHREKNKHYFSSGLPNVRPSFHRVLPTFFFAALILTEIDRETGNPNSTVTELAIFCG
jgi:hypothetical protein